MARRTAWTAVFSFIALGSNAFAQFDSGSDGSFGDITVELGTAVIELPPDGIINATTVDVASGAVLRFQRNSLNTPVYLLATGDVTIEGTVNVSGAPGLVPAGGQGGPGGFAGGNGGVGGNPSSEGRGPGGGGMGKLPECNSSSAQGGAYASAGQCGNARVYGSSLLTPLIGGSGGGGLADILCTGGCGGGGGGGAILIASNTSVQISGTVNASGGNGSHSSNEGSGGAIRIVAPAVNGTGTLNVTSGDGSPSVGAGRIRIDTLDTAGMSLTLQGSATVGQNMFVFPDVLPRLDLIEVAGQPIPEDTQESFLFMLPFGESTMQTVTVQARDFIGIVPITIALIPENGPREFINTEIDMSTGNPAMVQEIVDFTADATHIQVWTR